MIAEYNNVTRQNRFRQYLKGSSIMEKEMCDTCDGLENIGNIISSFTPQGPRS